MTPSNLTARHGSATIPPYGWESHRDRRQEPVCHRRAFGLRRRQQRLLILSPLTPCGLICSPAWHRRRPSSRSCFRCVSRGSKSPSSRRRRPWLRRRTDSARKVGKRAGEGALNRAPLWHLNRQQGMGPAAARLAAVDTLQPLGQLDRAGRGAEGLNQAMNIEAFLMPTMPAAGQKPDVQHEVIFEGPQHGHEGQRTWFVLVRQRDDIPTRYRSGAAPAARPKPCVAESKTVRRATAAMEPCLRGRTAAAWWRSLHALRIRLCLPPRHTPGSD